MGSWPIVTCDGVPSGGPGPKFLICEPLGPVVGEGGSSVSITVREMTQQVCHRRLEFDDAITRNLVDSESIEKAKCKAQSRFVDRLSSGEISVAQDTVRGLEYLEARTCSEEVCVSQELVLGLHAELWRYRDPNKAPGQLRTCCAYGRKGNDIHWFPQPHVIPSSFAARLKKHNFYISKRTSFADQYTPEYVNFVCRCAASLLYDLVELRPFRDGNDLVAHLLASNVLRLLAPFPVTLSGVSVDLGSLDERRGVFLDTMCWERDNVKPAVLATSLLEGLWQSWDWFASQLDLEK